MSKVERKERIIDEIHRAQSAYYQILLFMLSDPKDRAIQKKLHEDMQEIIKRNDALVYKIEGLYS
jgi:hypothetical protein